MVGSITEDIFTRLGRESGEFYGETFSLSDANHFYLLDTPGLWGHDPRDNSYWVPANSSDVPTYKCKRLLDVLYTTIVQATRYLDISTLWHIGGGGFPDGRFLQTIQEGLGQIERHGNRPLIRIMMGLPVGSSVYDEIIVKWAKQLVGDNSDLTLYIGTNHTEALSSWNHSKIVASDGKQVVVGGHNMWERAYMGFAPIHDVSARIVGPAAITAHGMCNALWRNKFQSVRWHKGSYTLESPPSVGPLQPSDPGITTMLALGRLGNGIAPKFTKNSDASVFARVTAMLRAESIVRISQQGLGFKGAWSDISSFDVPTMAVIAKLVSMRRKVHIVLSNDGALDGKDKGDPYSGTTIADTCKYLALFTQWQLDHGFPPPDDPDAYFKLRPPTFAAHVSTHALKLLHDHLILTTLRFSAAGGNWTYNGLERIPGNHAKVYIIDDTNFYVGSDNFYRSGTDRGLQEFGYLIEGRAETGDFLKEYWDKLWQYSEQMRHPITWPAT